MEQTKTYGAFGWINRHARLLIVGVLLAALGLGVVGSAIANTDEPNFDPEAAIFEIDERANSTLRSGSSVESAAFLVEAALRLSHQFVVALRGWFVVFLLHEPVQRIDLAGEPLFLLDGQLPLPGG